jgi:hypothetical protein
MKKLFFFFILSLLVIACACQRSQFATTTRLSRNGKTTYVNQHRTEWKRTSGPQEHLIASTSKEPVILASNENPIEDFSPDTTTRTEAPRRMAEDSITRQVIKFRNGSSETVKIIYRSHDTLQCHLTDEPNVTRTVLMEQVDTILPVKPGAQTNEGDDMSDNLLPDTTTSAAAPKRTADDSITRQVIKFRNGSSETVNIISRSHDTLQYHLAGEPNVTRTVLMNQVDTILLMKSGEQTNVHGANRRKTEPLSKVALAFSIVGFLPVIGIPFALLAIIFGAVSLHKIHRHPEKYKGKNRAITGIVLGILAILVCGILLFAAAADMTSGGGGSVYMGGGI